LRKIDAASEMGRLFSPACHACLWRRRDNTEHKTRRKAMSDFLSEVQSDELAECVDYQEWIDLRRLEAINQMEIDYNQMSQECWEMLND
jgi:hypothetical protein|tara:strand:+ start:986 stop:1252 length:267 start_codon:yes stop_codon:yes gene_type:complete